MTAGRGRRRIRDAIEAAQPVPSAGAAVSATAPAYLSSRFSMRDEGLFRNSDDPNKSFWVCGVFAVEAELRDDEKRGWGLLISWHDRDGARHEEAFSRALFAGECAEVRARLADGGLSLNGAQSARQALAEYLNLVASTRRACSVPRVGWHTVGGRPVFVLPDKTFGEARERVVLQTDSREPPLFNVAGTAADWRDNIGLLCCGNSRLLFAASCGFAAPVLGIVGEDGGGFNLRGASRSGKSTVLKVAASVCGGVAGAGAQGFVRQWRATGNGLESVAGMHSDNLLPLDEMGQVDAREAGEIAYMLANGQGKARAARSGLAKPALRFRVLFLSTGEIGLADKNIDAGKGTKAGMEVRLADLPSDAGAGLGAFEDLHDHENADAFSRTLRDAAGLFYGAPLRAFLSVLVDRWGGDLAGFPDNLRRRAGELLRTWLEEIPGAGGQVRSVGFRFALVGLAGELATEAGLTGWGFGVAADAARACFRSWLVERGTVGAREDAQAVLQLRGFLLANGAARFDVWSDAPVVDAVECDPGGSDLPPIERFRTMKRAGWRRWEAGERGQRSWCYYLTAEGLNEALVGLGGRDARRTLVRLGYLVPPKNAADGDRGNLSSSYSVPGHGKVRLYRISNSILDGSEGID